ncbi:interleukin-8-like [Alligator sinensis]|uniref:Interleukin-8-like n=1 Tax=Alligator sinensis TaxID=38654 RepID=A0A1U7S7N0_ALLSI|nr:interleukin-8-like [Alligator sinensis]
MRPPTAILLLALLVICHSVNAGILETNTRLACKCIMIRSQYIHPKVYQSVEIFPPGSACRRTEVIITLKNGNKVCVDPEIRWVKKTLKALFEAKEK